MISLDGLASLGQLELLGTPLDDFAKPFFRVARGVGPALGIFHIAVDMLGQDFRCQRWKTPSPVETE
jgi:hypothetical protein